MTPTPERAMAIEYAKSEIEFCEKHHIRGVVNTFCKREEHRAARILLSEVAARELAEKRVEELEKALKEILSEVGTSTLTHKLAREALTPKDGEGKGKET